MMTAWPPVPAEPRVDDYLDGLPEWQREICERVREIVHAADPDGRGDDQAHACQPYFVLDGNVCALLATRDHVNVFLYDGAIVPDPDGIITGGHENKTARTVSRSTRASRSTSAALRRMFEQIIANNRAGGWRRIKRSTGQQT